MSPQQWHDLFHIGDLRAAYQIADRVKDRVLIDRLGPVALAVAAHVGGNDMEARLSQRVDLAVPGVRDFREAVAEQNKRALTLFDDIRRDQWIGGSSLGPSPPRRHASDYRGSPIENCSYR